MISWRKKTVRAFHLRTSTARSRSDADGTDDLWETAWTPRLLLTGAGRFAKQKAMEFLWDSMIQWDFNGISWDFNGISMGV